MSTSLVEARKSAPATPGKHDPSRPLPQTDAELLRLPALTEAGLAIVRAQLDVDALCELVYEHVARIVEVHSFHLGLFEGDQFTLKVWIQDGDRRPPAAFPGAQNTGIVGWLRASQQPLLVRDFEAEMDSLPARPSYLSDNPPRSAVFVPLVAGETVVGSMSVQHAQPNAYDEDDLQILGIIANQAASAITNARLFATAQRRADQLMAIAEVGYAITAVLDLDDLLASVVELIRERFGYYHVQVFLVEDETHRAVFRASTGHQINQLWREQGRSQRFGEGIIGWVAGMGQHLLANDVAAEPRYIADDPRLLPDTRSELAVPLKVEDEVLGVLDVQSQTLNAFTNEDLFVLNALANQVAVAVDAAWSYRAQQEEAWITTVLLQIAEATNRVDTLEDVLSTVVRLIPMLTGVASCAIWLLDEDLDVFELASSYGTAGQLEAKNPSAGQRHMKATGESPNSSRSAIADWDRRGAFQRQRISAEGTVALALLRTNLQPLELGSGDEYLLPPWLWQSLSGDQVILLPLLAQNRLVGSLMVGLDSEDVPVRLRSKRLSLLSGIANQTASAIESVRLATAHQEEAWISWALLEVSRAIGNARTVEEMLNQVVRLAPLLAGIDRCAAFLRQSEDDEFVMVAQYLGRGTHVGSFSGQRLAPGDLPLLDLAVATRRLKRVEDATKSALVPAKWAENVGSRTLIALPLVAQDEVRGALLVDDADIPIMVSQRRVDILEGIAKQVGLAMENFLLLAQEKERARLAQELQVARSIQASYLPSTTPQVQGYEIAHTWSSAREVGGDFYDFIKLADGRIGLLMADVADKGVPAALFMATSLTLLRVSAHNFNAPDRVLARSNQLIGANNRTDMFVTVWYGILDPEAHRVDYANAGHGLALHVRQTDGEVQRLKTAGVPLGVFEPAGIVLGHCTLESGDLLVLYTDGVIDALNEQGEEFGQDRLESILFGQRHQSAKALVDAVIRAVQRHAGSVPLGDDITLAIVKRLGDSP